jgi:ferrous iron transport protein B
MPDLLAAVSEVASGQVVGKPYRVKYESPALQRAVAELTKQIETAYPDLPNARWVAMRLLDGDERIAEALRKGELGDLTHGDLEQRAMHLQVIGNQ